MDYQKLGELTERALGNCEAVSVVVYDDGTSYVTLRNGGDEYVSKTHSDDITLELFEEKLDAIEGGRGL
jgi:hypothetical protein